ncbi:MAG: type III-B CRISPR module RAMP protein Cmr6 [Desulfonauticus sp.]|nr:type III-B CRISPR module RAMP protein Cmr6 [Desulfonauticus sp.]
MTNTVFMDAYPFKWPNKKLFRLDVMNPHYGKYYENPAQNPPSDWYNPVPIFYLTVNTDVKYCFIVASKENSLLSKTKEWLEFALKNIGIGAKGSQGYGIFV